MLDGLEEVAEEIFDLPIRRGDPTGVGGLVDRVNTPDYATTVGLILYGYKQLEEKGITKERKKGLLVKVKNWLKEA
jgi:cell division protein FtsA